MGYTRTTNVKIIDCCHIFAVIGKECQWMYVFILLHTFVYSAPRTGHIAESQVRITVVILPQVLLEYPVSCQQEVQVVLGSVMSKKTTHLHPPVPPHKCAQAENPRIVEWSPAGVSIILSCCSSAVTDSCIFTSSTDCFSSFSEIRVLCASNLLLIVLMWLVRES